MKRERDWATIACLSVSIVVAVVGGVAAKHKSDLEAKIMAMPAAAPTVKTECKR